MQPESRDEGLGPWRPWTVPLALAAAFGILWPLVRLRFLGDDFIWVYEASRQTLAGLFQRGYFEFVRPTNELFWLLMWWTSGTDPAGYHLLALGLHLLTALLLYAWLREVTGSPWSGLLGLGLFLASPRHAEPVGWPSACSEVLAGAFVLATLFCYRRYRLGGGGRWMALTVASLLLALTSKESSICVFPGLVAVEAVLVPPREPLSRRFLALGAILVPGVLVLAAAALAVRPDHGYSTSVGARSAGIWLAYTSRALLGWGLFDLLAGVLPRATDPAALGLLLGALALAWRRAPAAFMHLAWLPFTVLAYAVFVPDQAIADRYFYLSSLALAGAGGGALAAFRGKGARAWAFLVSLAVLLGAVNLAQKARWMAETYPLPQPEALTLPAALAHHRPGSPVYVYCPPQVELHPLYACAVLGGLDLATLHPWNDVLRQSALPEGSAAIFWDGFTTRFWDCTEAVRADLSSMVQDGRAPRIGLGNMLRQVTELARWVDGQGWVPENLRPTGPGTWRTLDLRGRLVSPEFQVSPFAVQWVDVEVEVLQAEAGARCLLGWRTRKEPQRRRPLEVSSPLPPPGTTARLRLVPGHRPQWWTQGDILQLEVIPSSAPAEVRVRSIGVYGYAR